MVPSLHRHSSSSAPAFLHRLFSSLSPPEGQPIQLCSGHSCIFGLRWTKEQIGRLWLSCPAQRQLLAALGSAKISRSAPRGCLFCMALQGLGSCCTLGFRLEEDGSGWDQGGGRIPDAPCSGAQLFTERFSRHEASPSLSFHSDKQSYMSSFKSRVEFLKAQDLL